MARLGRAPAAGRDRAVVIVVHLVGGEASRPKVVVRSSSTAAVKREALEADVAKKQAAAAEASARLEMQEAAAVVEEPPTPPPFNPKAFAESMAGVSGPLGFFDPLGYCNEATEGKIRFYREVEVKHCRVAMLAALGYPIAEQFHPLFATDDAPSFSAFQQTPLQTFWPAVVFAIAIPEIFSVFSFNSPLGG